MELEEIKSSGLLELYALGLATSEESKMVEDALMEYVELKEELLEIEKAFYYYAQTVAVQPSPGLKERILQQARQSADKGHEKTNKNRGTWGLGIVALLAIGALAYLLGTSNKKLQALQSDFTVLSDRCDSVETANEPKLQIFDQIQSPNNEIAVLNPTPKYPETNIFFHHNETDDVNFIQVVNLPTIAANQSFQLWSLKDGQDPIPLDVFQGDGQAIFAVSHEDQTVNYAITIEPRGGSQTPNLEELIGVIPIS